ARFRTSSLQPQCLNCQRQIPENAERVERFNVTRSGSSSTMPTPHNSPNRCPRLVQFQPDQIKFQSSRIGSNSSPLQALREKESQRMNQNTQCFGREIRPTSSVVGNRAKYQTSIMAEGSRRQAMEITAKIAPEAPMSGPGANSRANTPR